ncbi:hypothetical protein KKC60_01735 [Patescibacteria group bacterium]|nr:hypothetical protein [Patescibacteria group bacterium]
MPDTNQPNPTFANQTPSGSSPKPPPGNEPKMAPQAPKPAGAKPEDIFGARGRAKMEQASAGAPSTSPQIQTPPRAMKRSGGGAAKVIIAAVIAAIVGAGGAGAGVYFWQNSAVATLNAEYEQQKITLENQISTLETQVTALEQEKTALQQKVTDAEAAAEATIVDATTVTSSDKAIALKDGSSVSIADIQGNLSEGETVGSVMENSDGNLYLGTLLQEDGSTQSSLHVYDVATKELKGVFENTSTDSKYIMIGMAGNNLIMLKQPADYSPGICFNPWVISDTETLSHVSIDATATTPETAAYKVPAEKITEATAEVEACSKKEVGGEEVKVTKRMPQGYYQDNAEKVKTEVKNPLKTITVYFDAAIDSKTLTSDNVKVTSGVAGPLDTKLDFDTTDNKLSITLETPVEPSATEKATTVTVKLENLKSTDGASMKDYEYYIDVKK